MGAAIGGRQGLRGMCRTVLEACGLALWWVTGCWRHVELYLDA